MQTLFKFLAELCEKLEATSKRLVMIDLVAEFLDKLNTDEVEPTVSMLLGRPLPERSQLTLDVSWMILSKVIKSVTGADWRVFDEAFGKTGDIGSAIKTVFESSKTKRQTALFEKDLTLTEVSNVLNAIAEIAGPGSAEKRERLASVLLSQSSPLEAKYLVKIFIGEMRTGFHKGLMEKAVSKAFQVPLGLVQEANMIVGDVAEVAAIAKTDGLDGLSKVDFKVFRPVSLMLAQTVENVGDALRWHAGRTAFEYKYDGVRVQVHKFEDKVRVFSRRLTDVTESLPEIVQVANENVRAREAILEGEVIAVDESERPVPFQHLMRRLRRVHDVEGLSERIPVKVFVFDILYLDGKRLISLPYLERRRILADNVGQMPLASQVVTDDESVGLRFLEDALKAGHEGLMAKRVDSPYVPGVRGKHWLKIKPVLELLDLVVVAAEYGYGRRHGWLSDYYLAARDDETGEFPVVGKTFKGLTDAEIMEMTRRLKELTVREESRRVFVIPSVVVEVAYNEVQTSPKYECGMALRFARITRIRSDKTAEEADTIQKVRRIYEEQLRKKKLAE